MVALAIESTKDFVDSYVVVDNSDDRTLDIIRECQRRWGLEMKIFHKPDLPDLAEKRYWAMRQSKADWLMFVDGDHVFHTDGPSAVQQIRPCLEDLEDAVWFSTSNYLWGPPGSFATWRSAMPDQKDPILIPHPFLYRNSPKLEACLGVFTADLPHLPESRYREFPTPPAFWDVCCKSPKRLFLRGWLIQWRTAQDYERYPTLETFVRAQLHPATLEERLPSWWEGEARWLFPYDEQRWGYYPKTLRQAMGKD